MKKHKHRDRSRSREKHKEKKHDRKSSMDGFIDDEDSKESSLSLKDNKRGMNGDDEGDGVMDTLLNGRRSLLGFIGNGETSRSYNMNNMSNPEDSPTSPSRKKTKIEADECTLNQEL